jgi:protein-S-isoprenylcysteine O-methyltransferase Ste14
MKDKGSTMLAICLLSALLLILAAYVVFRWIVRRDYLGKGRLTLGASILQLLVFFAVMCFPYLYNPPEWGCFWVLDDLEKPHRVVGFILICLGFVSAFGAMFWFGLRRAFGLEVSGLIRHGPYRYTRNPQVIGGSLLIIGPAVQWPSWYSLGWLVLFGVICHMMVLTEEEYLRAKFGEEYRRYCQEVPRYLFNWERLLRS